MFEKVGLDKARWVSLRSNFRAFALLTQVVGQMFIPNWLVPRSPCLLAPPASPLSSLEKPWPAQIPCLSASAVGGWILSWCFPPGWALSLTPVFTGSYMSLSGRPPLSVGTPQKSLGKPVPFPGWTLTRQTSPGLWPPRVWSCPSSACHDFSATQGPQQPSGPPALPEPLPESRLSPSLRSGGSTSLRWHLWLPRGQRRETLARLPSTASALSHVHAHIPHTPHSA